MLRIIIPRPMKNASSTKKLDQGAMYCMRKTGADAFTYPIIRVCNPCYSILVLKPRTVIRLETLLEIMWRQYVGVCES